MKNLKFLFLCVLLITTVILPNQAQEKREQLWLIGTEVVKPEMLNEYIEINKELLTICKEINFPFNFQFWTTGDFRYYIWYHINSMDDATKINSAWDSVVARYGVEKFRRFNECIEFTEEKFATVQLDLSYVPVSPRIKEDERGYCRWEAFYLKKGKEKEMEMEALVKKANEASKAKNISDETYIGYGKMGFEMPVMLLWTFAKSVNDFWEQDSKNQELLKSDFVEINKEAINYFRKEEHKDTWLLKNLSYSKIK